MRLIVDVFIFYDKMICKFCNDFNLFLPSIILLYIKLYIVWSRGITISIYELFRRIKLLIKLFVHDGFCNLLSFLKSFFFTMIRHIDELINRIQVISLLLFLSRR